jgi:hypothetical protein
LDTREGIVSGNIGVKEIERLIQKLEIDKEILADQDEETAPEEEATSSSTTPKANWRRF